MAQETGRKTGSNSSLPGICDKFLHFLEKFISFSTSEAINLESRRPEAMESVSHEKAFEVAIEHIEGIKIGIHDVENKVMSDRLRFIEEHKVIGRTKSDAKVRGKIKDDKDSMRKRPSMSKKGGTRERDMAKDERKVPSSSGKMTQRVASNIDERSGTYIKERKQSFGN